MQELSETRKGLKLYIEEEKKMKLKENIFNKIIKKILNLKKEISTKVQEEYKTPNREDKKYSMP